MKPGGQICPPDLALEYVYSSPSLEPKAAKKFCTLGGEVLFYVMALVLKGKNTGFVPFVWCLGITREKEKSIIPSGRSQVLQVYLLTYCSLTVLLIHSYKNGLHVITVP